MARGLYILANDVVFDQLIALINSIERNIGRDMPICIVPYDDRIQRSKLATRQYQQVQWFEDKAILLKWEQFAERIWRSHPMAFDVWSQRGIEGVNRMGMHRRFCCFDGPFERFVYLDADILVMNSFDRLFDSLDDHDFVTYDYQYKDLSHVFDVSSRRLPDVFESDRLETEIFCAGLYAAKAGLFTDELLTELAEQLEAGDSEILYFNGPDQTILNYMVMKSGIDAINLSQHLPAEKRTGCCVTSDHFFEKDHVLLDSAEQLTYLHYIGIGAKFFQQVCSGQNILFPYRDLFLYYRYLKEETAPALVGPAVRYDRPDKGTLRQRISCKVRQLLPG
ncbi:sugar transferase [cf. Phormidesmis sp. LEGE 11477]|nr:sugar transferase [cf. Phormidesmis sp. LEGE 11477]